MIPVSFIIKPAGIFWFPPLNEVRWLSENNRGPGKSFHTGQERKDESPYILNLWIMRISTMAMSLPSIRELEKSVVTLISFSFPSNTLGKCVLISHHKNCTESCTFTVD